MCVPGASTCSFVRSADLHRKPCERPPSRLTNVWKLKTAGSKPETCKIEAVEILPGAHSRKRVLPTSLLTYPGGCARVRSVCAVFPSAGRCWQSAEPKRGALSGTLGARAAPPCVLTRSRCPPLFGCRLRWCGGRALCDSLKEGPGGWDRGGAVCRPGINRKALQSDQVEFAAPSERIV